MTSLRNWWSRRRAAGDAGFTLSEMLVTIVLFTVLGTILMNVLITSMKAQTRSVERTTALNDAKRTLERAAADMRGANPLLVAESRQVKFAVTLNGVETTTTYAVSVDGTELQVTHLKKTLATGVTAPAATTTSMSGLTLGASSPAFTYYGSAGTALPPLTTGGTVFDTSEVRLIGITLPIMLPIDNKTIRLDQQVSVRNQEGS